MLQLGITGLEICCLWAQTSSLLHQGHHPVSLSNHFFIQSLISQVEACGRLSLHLGRPRNKRSPVVFDLQLAFPGTC